MTTPLSTDYTGRVLEAISECYDNLRPLTVRRRSRGPRGQTPPAHDVIVGHTFNILMVISGPAGKEDIDPSLGSRSIISIIRSLPILRLQDLVFGLHLNPYERDRKVRGRAGVRAHGSTLYISIRTEQSRTASPTYSFFQA